jgi:hypothetical protein
LLRTRTRTLGVIGLLFLLVVLSGTAIRPNVDVGNDPKRPLLMPQGPIHTVELQAPTGAYWFQVGAQGDASSSGHYGASVMIRTVYDQANNDAHSYWVGGYLSNGAFIQVGYLTTVSTDGSPYCCAWFYEYFEALNSSCCAPIIGPEFSAGPIGSWHSYKMDSNLNNTWSFYMDGKLLVLPGSGSGTTPDLGTGNSGTHPPAALAEVADTSNDRDTLGPAEFGTLSYRATTQPTDWRTVPTGLGLVTYGAPSKRDLPNPYGSVEITGVDNDFLAGSRVPQPVSNTMFWPASRPLGGVTFEFHDKVGNVFFPDWISLYQSGAPSTRVYYTGYSQQLIDPAVWILDVAMWHNSNVSPQSPTSQVDTQFSTRLVVNARVFPLFVHVVGYLLPYPVAGARVLTSYPDSLAINSTSDQNGDAVFSQIPLGNYTIRAVAPRGLQSTVHSQITDSTNLTVRVFGLPELLFILIVPVAAAIIIVVIAVRRERVRKKIWESITLTSVPPPNSPPPPSGPPP